MPGGFEFDYEAMRTREDKCRPLFFMETIVDEAASVGKDIPVFKDIEMVKVHIPGNQREIPIFHVKDKHRLRWAKQYEAFKAGEDTPLDGYPLAEWPPVTKAIVKTLASVHIRTLEDLVAAPETELKRIGPMFYNLKFKAKEFLDNHGSEKARIGELEEQNTLLMERLSKLEDASSKFSEEPKVSAENTKAPKAKATTKAK